MADLSDKELDDIEEYRILDTEWGFTRRLIAEVRRHRAVMAMLHAQVDQTAPGDPVGVALTRAGAAVDVSGGRGHFLLADLAHDRPDGDR